MTEAKHQRPVVVRTSRGLTIAGTRKTLYQVMDYVAAGWPAALIRDWMDLTDEQLGDVMAYIAEHRAAVEEEHHYWEARNQERFAQIAAMPPRTDHPEARARLAAAKAKRPRL